MPVKVACKSGNLVGPWIRLWNTDNANLPAEPSVRDGDMEINHSRCFRNIHSTVCWLLLRWLWCTDTFRGRVPPEVSILIEFQWLLLFLFQVLPGSCDVLAFIKPNLLSLLCTSEILIGGNMQNCCCNGGKDAKDTLPRWRYIWCPNLLSWRECRIDD